MKMKKIFLATSLMSTMLAMANYRVEIIDRENPNLTETFIISDENIGETILPSKNHHIEVHIIGKIHNDNEDGDMLDVDIHFSHNEGECVHVGVPVDHEDDVPVDGGEQTNPDEEPMPLKGTEGLPFTIKITYINS